MIEDRTRPTGRRVACVAGDREARRRRGWIVGRVVIRQMTRFAGGVGQPVIIIDMASRAQNCRMEAGEWESSAAVIPR